MIIKINLLFVLKNRADLINYGISAAEGDKSSNFRLEIAEEISILILNPPGFISKEDCKVFILPKVAELLNHKEKQRGCPQVDANKYTHIHIYEKYIYIYIS